MNEEGPEVNNDVPIGGKGRSHRSGRLRDLLLCVLVLSACIPPIYALVIAQVCEGAAPGMYDAHRYFTPQAFAFDYAIHQGEVPLWNPLSFCGVPFAANPQNRVFFPPELLRSLSTGSPTPMRTYWSLLAAMAVYSLLAGSGMFFLARSQGCSRSAGLVAAFTLVFSVPFVLRALSFHFLPALAFVPYTLLALSSMARSRTTRSNILFGLGAGLLMGLSLLSGFIQIYAHILLLCGFFWLLARFYGDADARPRRFSGIHRDAAGLAALILTAGLICLPIVIPAARLSGLSGRVRDTALVVTTWETAIPWTAAIGRMLWASPEHHDLMEGHRAAGMAVYLLIVCAWLAGPRRPVLRFTVLMLILIDCSLGRPFPFATLLETLAPFRMAFPGRAMIVACIPMGMLAAFGVDGARRLGFPRYRLLLATGLILIAGHLVTAQPPWLAVCQSAIIALLLVLSRSGVSRRLPRIAAPGMAVVVLVECLIWSQQAIPHYLRDQTAYDISDAFRGERILWQDNLRAVDPAPNRHLCLLEGAVNGYDPIHLRHVRDLVVAPGFEAFYDRILYPGVVTRYTNRRSALLLKRTAWLTREYAVGPLPPKTEAFPPTTTVFLAEPPPAPLRETPREQVSRRCVSWEAAQTPLGPLRAVESMSAPGASHPTLWRVDMPDFDEAGVHSSLVIAYRMAGAGQLQVEATESGSGRRHIVMSASVADVLGEAQSIEIPMPDFPIAHLRLAFEPNRSDARFAPVALTWYRDRADEGHLLRVLERSFNRVAFEAGPLDEHRILVLLDAAYPGWTATLDGRPVEILIANEAFKAVVVPPGTHRVVFEFRPADATLTLAASSTGLAALLLLLCILARARVNASRA